MLDIVINQIIISVKRLTKNNPTMAQKFAEIDNKRDGESI